MEIEYIPLIYRHRINLGGGLGMHLYKSQYQNKSQYIPGNGDPSDSNKSRVLRRGDFYLFCSLFNYGRIAIEISFSG
jgi:hypothetical protein